MTVISPNHTFDITDGRPDFDQACRQARKYALRHWGIDEEGHTDHLDVRCWERSDSEVIVKFVEMNMLGSECVYRFTTWCEKNDDD